MNFTITSLPKSEAEIEVTLIFSEFEPIVRRAASALSEKIEIEGFRKGKAPYDVLKAKIGEMAIYEEAAERAVRKTYPEIIQELREEKKNESRDFAPIGRPEITVTKLAPGNDFAYKAKIALLPAVTLPDWQAITRKILAGEKNDHTVSDEEVDKSIRWLQEARTTLVTVARPAAKGDRVEVDFEIRHNGVKIENGESKNHPLIIGESRFLPGFEDEVSGLEAGTKKTFTLTAPENWHDKGFAGKPLDITAEVKLVQERIIPELTDEFAKGLGDFASVDALKNTIREGLTQEKKAKETQRVRGMIASAIAGEALTELPDILILGELDKMLGELASGVKDMGMQWEDYLIHIKKTPEDLKKEWQSEAEKRVRIALCLREIARQEHIEPTEEEIALRASEILKQYPSPEDATKNIDPAELKEYARGILKNEKVFERLEKI